MLVLVLALVLVLMLVLVLVLVLALVLECGPQAMLLSYPSLQDIVRGRTIVFGEVWELKGCRFKRLCRGMRGGARWREFPR